MKCSGQRVPFRWTGLRVIRQLNSTFSLTLHFLAEQVSKGSVKGLLRLEVKLLVIFLSDDHSVWSLPLLIHNAHVKYTATISPAENLPLVRGRLKQAVPKRTSHLPALLCLTLLIQMAPLCHHEMKVLQSELEQHSW